MSISSWQSKTIGWITPVMVGSVLLQLIETAVENSDLFVVAS
jgi:uncharacterized membrane-anchored protein YhcB (DUF1043 family)